MILEYNSSDPPSKNFPASSEDFFPGGSDRNFLFVTAGSFPESLHRFLSHSHQGFNASFKFSSLFLSPPPVRSFNASFRIFQDLSGSFRIFQDHWDLFLLFSPLLDPSMPLSGSFRIVQDRLGSFRIFRFFFFFFFSTPTHRNRTLVQMKMKLGVCVQLTQGKRPSVNINLETGQVTRSGASLAAC